MLTAYIYIQVITRGSDDEGSKHRLKFGQYLPDYMAHRPRTHTSLSSSPWEPEILHTVGLFVTVLEQPQL
jgi:hypothetical protein